WWRIASEFADRGYAMLVVIGGSAAVALERMHELEALNASGPIEPLVLDRPERPEPEPERESGAEPEPEPVPQPDPEPECDAEPVPENPDEPP
ncbi:hypothetical protein R0J87_19765, partial [Halomonas sp. SIMBA_159]